MALEDLRYIAVEGVIGAGKTSLAARLSQTMGAKALYEEFEKNPFLEDFYESPERYAFQTQLFFSNEPIQTAAGTASDRSVS